MADFDEAAYQWAKNRIQERRHELALEEANLDRGRDAAMLKARPEFPTDVQRAGIIEALRRISAEEKPACHLGDPTPTFEVVVDGPRGWLHVRHGSPYSATGRGGHLWSFTEAEVQAFLALIETQGYRVREHWLSDGGLSIIAFPIN